jgi:hypothetical protein
MRLGVKRDEVRAQQSVNQFPLPDKFQTLPDSAMVCARKSPLGIGPRLFHHSRQQREMVVLRQHDRRFHSPSPAVPHPQNAGHSDTAANPPGEMSVGMRDMAQP